MAGPVGGHEACWADQTIPDCTCNAEGVHKWSLFATSSCSCMVWLHGLPGYSPVDSGPRCISKVSPLFRFLAGRCASGDAHDLENLNGGPCWTSAGDFHCRLPQGRRIVWDYVQQAEDRLQFMSRRLPAIQSLGAHSAPFQAGGRARRDMYHYVEYNTWLTYHVKLNASAFTRKGRPEKAM